MTTDRAARRTNRRLTLPISRALPALALTLALSGCMGTTSEESARPVFDPATLVPASGVVTVNGKPTPGVVLTVQPTAGGIPAVGESDAEGKFTLSTSGQPGATPGEAKVAISYLLSAEGAPQGVGARSSLVQPPAMLAAREKFPPEYADLGRTLVKATVVKGGPPLTFDVTADLAPPDPKAAKPKPKPPAGGVLPTPRDL